MLRSLAFLAATFAITLGSLLPAAVAASPALGGSVVLCSGDQITIVHDEHGQQRPADHTDLASLACASALLSGLAAMDADPPELPERLKPAAHRHDPAASTADRSVARHAPRPPSTAPPVS